MSSKETNKQSDEPLVETDSYRIWGGDQLQDIISEFFNIGEVAACLR